MPARRPSLSADAAPLCLCGLALLAGVALVGAAPASGERAFLVVFPPWTGQGEAGRAVAAAGARLLALPSRFVAAVHDEAPDAAGLLRAEGALLVVPAHLAPGCGARRRRERRA